VAEVPVPQTATYVTDVVPDELAEPVVTTVADGALACTVLGFALP
jgi:hypothetical protein